MLTTSGSSGAFATHGPAQPYCAAVASPRYPALRPPAGPGGTPRRVDRRPLPPIAPATTTTLPVEEPPKRPSVPHQADNAPRTTATGKFNVTWESSWSPSGSIVGATSQPRARVRRYFFTARGYDDERTSRIPGHFDVLLEDPSRTTSRTDHLRCSYVDFLGPPQPAGEDADAAAALAGQLPNELGPSAHLDVS